MALLVKGPAGTFLVVNGDGSINVVASGTQQADVVDRAARLLGHVVVDNLSSALDVTDRASRLVGQVSVSNFPLFQPVTGSVDVTDRSARVLGHAVVDNFPAVQTVVQPKDTARTSVTLSADRVAGRTTEALETLTINVGGTITTGTSYTVTSGKTLRLTSIQVEILNTSNVINRVTVRVRSAASVLVSSPVVAMGMAAALAAVATSGGQDGLSFPDGVDIEGSQQVGISQICNVTTVGIVSVLLQGYEF